MCTRECACLRTPPWVCTCVRNKYRLRPLLISLHTCISTSLQNLKICSEYFLKLSPHLYNGLTNVPRKMCSITIPHFLRNYFPPWHPIISARAREVFIVMTSRNKWHLYRYKENSPTSVTVWQLWYSAGYIKQLRSLMKGDIAEIGRIEA